MLTSIEFFMGNLLVFALGTRVLPAANRLLLFFVLGLTTGCLLIAYEYTATGSVQIQLFASVFSFAFLCALFLSCLGMSLTSVSASLLLKLRQGDMDESEIADLYSSDLMVSLRLDRMVQGGYLTEESERLQLTSKGRAMVRTFQFFQRLFRHQEEG